MAVYAKGSRAYGFCKQCGFRYYLHELKIDGRFPEQKLLVCTTCWDPWDAQEHPFPPIVDPEALKWPSPEAANPAVTVDNSNPILIGGGATTSFFTTYFGGNASTSQAEYGFNQVYGGNAYSDEGPLNI